MRFLVIMLVGLLAACGASKKKDQILPPVDETISKEVENSLSCKDVYCVCEVQMLECGTVLYFPSMVTYNMFVPTNLDSKFQVNNLRLKVKFVSKNKKSEKCPELTEIQIVDAFAIR